jgi:hypothetical protein
VHASANERARARKHYTKIPRLNATGHGPPDLNKDCPSIIAAAAIETEPATQTFHHGTIRPGRSGNLVNNTAQINKIDIEIWTSHMRMDL